MAINAKLKAMLTGNRKSMAKDLADKSAGDRSQFNDDPEDALEIKAGRFPSEKEEVLEDSKGRKIGMKSQSKKGTSSTKAYPKLRM